VLLMMPCLRQNFSNISLIFLL